MKKSQLKKIIRESIKELINENAPGYVKLNTRVCNGGMTMGLCVPTGAQVGDVYHVPSIGNNTFNRDVFIRNIIGSCPAHLYTNYGQPYPTSSTNCPNCCSTSQWQSYQDDIGGDCWANCPKPDVSWKFDKPTMVKKR